MIIPLLILVGLIGFGYKSFIVDSKLPVNKINQYLEQQQLVYTRHRKVKKPWDPNIESEENIFTSYIFRKHHYEIDANDIVGNPVQVEAKWYQSMSLLHKNKVIFKTRI